MNCEASRSLTGVGIHRTPLRTSHGKITLVMYNAPHPCGGACLFCFSTRGVTRSTTANEDTLLAAECDWDAAGQLEARFTRYGLARGTGLKCDLAVKGDSFANHDADYLRGFFRRAYEFLNGRPSASLEDARLQQADAPDRCVSVKVETRPDHVTLQTCELMRELGVTGVEIGVESLDDRVLQFNRRGHDALTVARATALLRSFGFEVGYQVMVGLPGRGDETDEELLANQLWLPEHSPDMLKIYPCLLLAPTVADQSPLADSLAAGDWIPMSSAEYVALLTRVYRCIPRWVHINGIQRMIPPEHIIQGAAEKVDRHMFDGISQCLWQRSVAQSKWRLDSDFAEYRISITQQAPGNYCVEAVMPDDTLVGYGRLSANGRRATIRDIRALGEMRRVGERCRGRGVQHNGIGTALLRAIEQHARSIGAQHIEVHPSAGTVRWFEERGFTADEQWCHVKTLEGC